MQERFTTPPSIPPFRLLPPVLPLPPSVPDPQHRVNWSADGPHLGVGGRGDLKGVRSQGAPFLPSPSPARTSQRDSVRVLAWKQYTSSMRTRCLGSGVSTPTMYTFFIYEGGTFAQGI